MKDKVFTSRRCLSRSAARALAGLCVCAAAVSAAAAQSADASFPTPIYSNVITGRVAPRDVGDPRRTRHFYAFRASEGDLTVALESANLSGDLDVFTARGLRPLLKITLIGGTQTPAAKSVYIRAEEALVLRVEARAVGEEEGYYRVSLGGSFAPAPPGLAEAEAPAPPEVSPESRRARGVRRVTATGARVEEPTRPPDEEAKAEPTPPEEVTRPAEVPAPAEEAGTTRPVARATNSRTGRSAPRRTRGRGAPAAERPVVTEGAASAEGETPNPPRTGGETETATAERGEEEVARPAPRARGRAARRGAGVSRGATNRPGPGARTTDRGEAEPSAPPAAAEPPQRLVIVTKSGETVEHDMGTVRRVTVENNQVVVTTKDGKTLRRPMSEVLRMSIEPVP